MKKSYLLLAFNLLLFSLNAQVNREQVIRSGPMIGYAEMREVGIWLQLKTSDPVQLVYRETPKSVSEKRTITQIPNPTDFYIVKFTIDSVTPGTAYEYDIIVNDQKVVMPYPTQFSTQIDFAYKTDPPNFRVATGSCSYINEPPFDRKGNAYGGEYFIFETIVKSKPDMMLWLGDNTYLRPADWTSRTGIFERYSHDRALSELQPLLACCPNYAIWDDHDFGPNDANRAYIHKDKTREAFDKFWMNPTSGNSSLAGTTTAFSFGDADFFLLDNRWFRTAEGDDNEHFILGKEQEDWLIEILQLSNAPFKIIAVGGQFLSDAAVYENHAVYKTERERIINRIAEKNIRGVVFLTGDRHHAELSKLTLPNGNTIWDLTTSPLTSGANTRELTEVNTNRVPGTLYQKRNFATLDFSGKRKDRVLTISLWSNRGEFIFSETIKEKEVYK